MVSRRKWNKLLEVKQTKQKNREDRCVSNTVTPQSSLFETCVPDNLEDVADSGFFFWDVQTIWTRPRHEVVLATVVRHKLERGGQTKQSRMNYSNVMSGSYCLGQFYEMLVRVYCTSIESSVLSTGGLRLMMLAVPSSASLSSFRKTPQNGTTYGARTTEKNTSTY